MSARSREDKEDDEQRTGRIDQIDQAPANIVPIRCMDTAWTLLGRLRVFLQ